MRWWKHSSLAVMAYILMFVPDSSLSFTQENSSYSPTSTPSSLFSTALRTRRMFDTSLQSSIIKLIRELMLTPKVYESMTNVADKRADSGRVLFPEEPVARSASIIFASPSARSTQTVSFPSSTMRAAALSTRTSDANVNNNMYEEGGIIRKGRAGKVERVPRPIIINGNSAALNAPRYNRMLEGPAPTVGGAVKIPPPSIIMSQPLRIIEGNRDSRGRSLKEIDVQGVRVIVGQRVPDDPEDKLFTWRNGRVIKGMWFPNDPSNTRPANTEESNDISKPSRLVVSSSYNF